MAKNHGGTSPGAANEKLAQVVMQCGVVLLSNQPMAMSDYSDQVKFGYLLMTLGVVGVRLATGWAAWLIRIKL